MVAQAQIMAVVIGRDSDQRRRLVDSMPCAGKEELDDKGRVGGLSKECKGCQVVIKEGKLPPRRFQKMSAIGFPYVLPWDGCSGGCLIRG